MSHTAGFFPFDVAVAEELITLICSIALLPLAYFEPYYPNFPPPAPSSLKVNIYPAELLLTSDSPI